MQSHSFTAKDPPMQPMLARPVASVAQVLQVLQGFEDEVIVETKYDGERLLIHYSNRRISLYSRNSELRNVKYNTLLTPLLELLEVRLGSLVIEDH